MKQPLKKQNRSLLPLAWTSAYPVLFSLLIIPFIFACDKEVQYPVPSLRCVPDLPTFLEGRWEASAGVLDSMGVYVPGPHLDTVSFEVEGDTVQTNYFGPCDFRAPSEYEKYVSECEFIIRVTRIFISGMSARSYDEIYSVQYYGEDNFMRMSIDRSPCIFDDRNVGELRRIE